MHMHGPHPGAPKIAFHHAIMGVLAITAGSTKVVVGRKGPEGPDRASPSSENRHLWRNRLGGLILLIGGQVLLYWE